MSKKNFLVLFFCLFLLLPFATAYPQCVDNQTGAIEIVGSTGAADAMVINSVIIKNAPAEIIALGFDIAYDPTSMLYDFFEKGPCIQEFDFFDCNEITPGLLRCGGFEAGNGRVLKNSTCTLMKLHFLMSASCTPGKCSPVEVLSPVDDINGWSTSPGCNCCSCSNDSDCSPDYTCKEGNCIKNDTSTDGGSTDGGGGGSGGTATSTVTVTTTVPAATTTSTLAVSTTTTTVTIAPPPDTTTTSTADTKKPCAVEKAMGSGNADALSIIRKFRDSRLGASAEGMTLITLYYNHTEEIARIFTDRLDLVMQSRKLIFDLLPVFAQCLIKDGRITLSEAQTGEIAALLKSISKEASPSLQKSISFVLKQLETGELLKGLNGSR